MTNASNGDPVLDYVVGQIDKATGLSLTPQQIQVFLPPAENTILSSLTVQQVQTFLANNHLTFPTTLGGIFPFILNVLTDLKNYHPPCFAMGTQLLTDAGEKAVEDLAVGDVLKTVTGADQPIRWIGHRRLDLTRHPDPAAVRPIRITAGAFGDGLPTRDLLLSPGHNLFVEGVLVPAKVLVNGTTVVQEQVDTVTYWHVELDSHDVILAEGLPAESYLDTGNRTAFVDGGAYLEMHPDFAARHPADTCAPIRKSGPEVEATRTRLLAHAATLGYATDADPDLHMVVDGRRLDAYVRRGRRFAFMPPAGTKSLALVSRRFVPSHSDPASTDFRELGVAVSRLQVDGADLDLATAMGTGWHPVEAASGGTRRWTSGSVALPADARLVVVDLVGEGRYPTLRASDDAEALTA